MAQKVRIEWLLFLAVFWVLAAFCPGGGWNQNSRFAQVRSIVEEGRLSIDDFLIYRRDGGSRMRRLPIHGGRVEIPSRQGSAAASGIGAAPQTAETVRLAWRYAGGGLVPIGKTPLGDGERLVALEAVAASGDVSFANGHFYPNKPPGTTLLAVPAYELILTAERLAGIGPGPGNLDDWRLLTLNAWLTTACSIGLATALGAVVLFRLAARFASRRVALGIALAWAFGTMAFPYGTMLFDLNLTALGLLAAFALLVKARDAEENRSHKTATPAALAVFAGLLGGCAVVSHYLAGPVLGLLALYAGVRKRSGAGGGGVPLWFPFAVGT